MARYLVVTNLGHPAKQDAKIFLSNPEVELVHFGVRRDVFNAQKRSTREILADARRGAFELIFVGNMRMPGFNPRKTLGRNLVNFIGKYIQHPHMLRDGRFPYSKISTPIAGLDLECCPIIDNSRFRDLERSVCFFKRDLPQNPSNAFLYTHPKAENVGNLHTIEPFSRWVAKLRPITLGIADALANQLSQFNVPKKADVFFAGEVEGRYNRMTGIRQLERLKAEGFNIDIPPERLSKDEFFRRCACAYLVWSPEGVGWDCYRHYEVAAAGTVPLMQMPPIYGYAPFKDDENAVYYHIEGDSMVVRIRKALQNRARLAEMGQAARQHVLRYHTHLALSRYVIEETRRTLAAAR